MNKKFCLLLILMLLLAGCAKDNSASLKKAIDNSVNEALSALLVSAEDNNCTKTYYSYFKNVDIGKVDGDEISNTFIIQGNYASLTLNVENIITNQIYSDANEYLVGDIGSFDDPIYVKRGRFTNSSDQLVPYKISICAYDKNKYFVLVQTSNFIFASSIESGNCASTIYDMLVLLRTCTVNESQVMLDYASESIVYHPTNIITLFEQVLPESGYIIDYIDNWKDDTSFIIIDNNEKESVVVEEIYEVENDGETQQEE